jgi:hypothetical protein
MCVHLQIELLQPHGNLLCKSGTDFKNVTAVTITMPEAAAAAGDGAAANGHSSGGEAAAAAAAAGRPSFSWQDHATTSDVPEDPDIKQVGKMQQHFSSRSMCCCLLCVAMLKAYGIAQQSRSWAHMLSAVLIFRLSCSGS